VASSRVRSLAVLPFRDLAGDVGPDYFVDGMTDALITNLAKLKSIRVISRTSATQYRNAGKLLPQIARELNVDAVVEGTVVGSGRNVTITAQLIDATIECHMGADSYQRNVNDILRLQNEVALVIAEQVQGRLNPQERFVSTL